MAPSLLGRLALLALFSASCLAAPVTPSATAPSSKVSLCDDPAVSWQQKGDQGCPICKDPEKLPAGIFQQYCAVVNPATAMQPVEEVWRRDEALVDTAVTSRPSPLAAIEEKPADEAKDVYRRDSEQKLSPQVDARSPAVIVEPTPVAEDEELVEQSSTTSHLLNNIAKVQQTIHPIPTLYRRKTPRPSHAYSANELQDTLDKHSDEGLDVGDAVIKSSQSDVDKRATHTPLEKVDHISITDSKESTDRIDVASNSQYRQDLDKRQNGYTDPSSPIVMLPGTGIGDWNASPTRRHRREQSQHLGGGDEDITVAAKDPGHV